MSREVSIPCGQSQRHHAHPILEPFQNSGPVDGSDGVGAVVGEGFHERGKPESGGVGPLEQGLDEREIVAIQHPGLVVPLRDEMVQLLPQRREEDRVRDDVMSEVGPHRIVIRLEPGASLRVVETQQGVEGTAILGPGEDLGSGPGQQCGHSTTRTRVGFLNRTGGFPGLNRGGTWMAIAVVLDMLAPRSVSLPGGTPAVRLAFPRDPGSKTGSPRRWQVFGLEGGRLGRGLVD